MKYGIISDIHGNLEALEVVINALLDEKIDILLCGGDIVGYCANPVECVEKIKELHPVTVVGNHDAACAGLLDSRYFNDAAREAILWTQNRLNDGHVAFLKELGFAYKNRDLTLVHGTLHEPEKFNYMFDADAAYTTFKLMENNVCFVGHSHAPGIFSYKNNRMNYFYREKIKLSKDEKVIVNVGSVGQPRDGNPRLCYSIYDVENGLVELKRLPYDIEKTQKKILDAGLPHFLAYRLSEGM